MTKPMLGLVQRELSKEQQMIVDKLSNVSAACKDNKCKFSAKSDTSGKGLDCISIFKHKSNPDTYYGLYHAMDASISNFILYLAESKDGLTNWKDIRELDKFASQGKTWTNPNGDDIVVAYE